MNIREVPIESLTKEEFQGAVAHLSPELRHKMVQKLAESWLRRKTLADWAAEVESNLARTAGTAEPSGNIKCE